MEILDDTKTRAGVSPYLSRRIKQLFNNEEALFLRKLSPNQLEIDHKFPQIRWGNNEKENSLTMHEDEIQSKFILLTRSNNLLKSRYCERCVKTGKRGHFPGIYFWHKGDENWRGENQYDEKGCMGCFWYDPYAWREELNKLVNK